MDYKLWILIIVWIGIVLTLVLSFAGFDFISRFLVKPRKIFKQVNVINNH